mmetsp:Transcript_14869/g.30209  ORF Transcript_14869/g.30209 Transcript_14869/m.30209 type:complete len:87 (+) Transcript_14869:201-461(+)
MIAIFLNAALMKPLHKKPATVSTAEVSISYFSSSSISLIMRPFHICHPRRKGIIVAGVVPSIVVARLSPMPMVIFFQLVSAKSTLQ